MYPNEASDPLPNLHALRKATTDGVLGFFRRAEVTEILAFTKGNAQPINVFTLIAVDEEEPTGPTTSPQFLNEKRLSLPRLNGITFGVCRYERTIEHLLRAVERLARDHIWDLSGKAVLQEASMAQPPIFVPPNSFQEIPINSILKNNFWNGSHVFEWADAEKRQINDLLTEPQRLQMLSEAFTEYLPIRLATLSDRIGNIVVQVPVAILMARFSGARQGNFILEIGWHPRATPRPLRTAVELEFDNMITGYCSAAILNERTELSMPPGSGSHRATLWDEEHQLLLAATGPSAFIRSAHLNFQRIAPEPRIFSLPDGEGGGAPQRVAVHNSIESLVGPANSDGRGGWTEGRIYKSETARQAKERQFVQYLPKPGRQREEHDRALADIRNLIVRYGESGAWLWDPYLSALDIMKTLFFSPHHGADLRGLSARKTACEDDCVVVEDNYMSRQQAQFASFGGNLYGLKLEFRARSGPAGWNFHDRFLIFPQKRKGALAWSLGTSVNSLGKAHHILQRVDDGQIVMDAFDELWRALKAPEHLVWRSTGA